MTKRALFYVINMEKTLVKKGDVIYSCVRPYLLNIAIIENDINPEPIVSTAFAVLDGHGLVAPRYLWIVLRSPYFISSVEGKMRGQAYPAINDGDFALMPFALPPLAEQHRIVAKVDELMKLCDELEAAQVKRERRRNRLVAATLHGLNNGVKDDDFGEYLSFDESARFYFNHFPRLTTRPEHIQQLRQTILDLAVRGKLVPQDPKDEPAIDLLKRIAVEKSHFTNTGRMGKDKSVSAIREEDNLFEVPPTWKWIRLDLLAELITKGSSPKWQGIQYTTKEKGILFITSENVGNYYLRKLIEPKYVEKRFNKIEPRSILLNGDILMNLVGASIGRTALYDLNEVANINQAVAIIRLIQISPSLNKKYLLHYFNSLFAIQLMLGSQVVTAQPNISLTDVREFPVPLPPLSEQQRIVAKVDELMRLCEELEAGITTTSMTRRRLLEATLHEALTAH